MQVQVNTSNGIENKETLERWADQFLNESLARFNQEITRVEVQLSDENSGKKGAADKRCMLEARLIRLLEHTFGKLDRHEHRDRGTIRKDSTIVE
jgi:hypothetical protein